MLDPVGVGNQQEVFASLRKEVQAKIHDLRVASLTNNCGAIESLTGWLLTSAHSKKFFALEVAGSGKLSNTPTLAETLSVAEQLDLEVAPPEKVDLRFKRKANGDARPILNFGHRYRTAHAILARVVSAHHRPAGWQFTTRGHKPAIKHALKLVNAGYKYAAHVDIKEFFGSFRVEKLLKDAALGGLISLKTVAAFAVGQKLEVKVDWKSLKSFSPHLSLSIGTQN